jgi:hypothetical protein
MNKIELLLDELNNSNYEVKIEGKRYMIIPCSVFDKNCDEINNILESSDNTLNQEKVKE